MPNIAISIDIVRGGWAARTPYVFNNLVLRSNDQIVTRIDNTAVTRST